MIFENQLNIPWVDDWIGFFGCMVECLRQQLERKNVAMLEQTPRKIAQVARINFATKSVNQLNTSTRQKTTTNFKRNKKCNGT